MMTFGSIVRAWPFMLATIVTSSWAVSAERIGGPSAGRAASLPNRFSDSDEVALAISAAPASLTAGAAVYVWRDGQFVKVRDGTTGFACLVTRDPRTNVVAPQCFDPEAARTLMQEEIMQAQLKAKGVSDKDLERDIDAAYQRGALRHPDHGAIIYMMSSKQLLTASPAEGNQPLGAWHPHLMIYIPHTSKAQLALGTESDAMPVSTPFKDDGGVLLVVQVPHWADSRVASLDASEHFDASRGTTDRTHPVTASGVGQRVLR
jgi:hypothetical protein